MGEVRCALGGRRVARVRRGSSSDGQSNTTFSSVERVIPSPGVQIQGTHAVICSFPRPFLSLSLPPDASTRFYGHGFNLVKSLVFQLDSGHLGLQGNNRLPDNTGFLDVDVPDAHPLSQGWRSFHWLQHCTAGSYSIFSPLSHLGSCGSAGRALEHRGGGESTRTKITSSGTPPNAVWFGKVL